MVMYDNLDNRIGMNVGFHRRIQEKAIMDLAAESGLTFERIDAIEDFSQKTVTEAEVKALAGALKINRDRLFDEFPHQDPSEHPNQAKMKQIAGQMYAGCPDNTNARLTGEAKNRRDYGKMLARQLNQKD